MVETFHAVAKYQGHIGEVLWLIGKNLTKLEDIEKYIPLEVTKDDNGNLNISQSSFDHDSKEWNYHVLKMHSYKIC